jgi:uncharacterized protein YukE
MSTIGASMDDLQALKSTFDQQTANVDQLIAAIDGQLSATWWQGPAADRFRDSWQSSFEPTLRQLEQSLQDSSTEVGTRYQALIDAGS